MKKRLLFIPLIASLVFVSACSQGGAKKKKSPTDSISEPDEGETTSSAAIKPRAETVEEGENHTLPWTLDYDSFKDPGNSPSYHAYNKTYDFDGTNIYCYGMRATTDITVSINGAGIAFSGFKIIHLAKLGHDTWIDGGQLQISKIAPSKLILEIVSYKNYSYNPNRTASVYVGDKLMTNPKASDIEINVSPIHEEFNIQTLTYDLNATSPGLIKIQNRNNNAMYFQSIRFE